MTDLIEAPRSRQANSPLDRGRSVKGTSGRSGPVYNPAIGEQTGAVDFATVEEVDAAGAACEGGLRVVARGLALDTEIVACDPVRPLSPSRATGTSTEAGRLQRLLEAL